MAGWDETNLFGRDRDLEIRLMKIHYKTETEKKWMLTETETRLSDFFMSETRLNSKFRARPRVSVSFFTRPIREPIFYKERTVYLAKFC